MSQAAETISKELPRQKSGRAAAAPSLKLALKQALTWRGITDRALPWLLPAALLIIWCGVSHFGLVSPQIFPGPGDVVSGFWSVSQTGELWSDLAVSTGRAFGGLAVGGSIGFVLGILNGISPLAAKLTDTTLQMVRNIPILALIPLTILWFGIGESAKIFLIALGVFFPVYLNTYHGIRNVDKKLVEMAHTCEVNGFQLFAWVIFPGALPSILVGLRYALGVMWLVLIVAEMVSDSSGIGYMTLNARDDMQTNIVVLGILIYALLGKLADWIAIALEKSCLRWHQNYVRAQNQ